MFFGEVFALISEPQILNLAHKMKKKLILLAASIPLIAIIFFLNKADRFTGNDNPSDIPVNKFVQDNRETLSTLERAQKARDESDAVTAKVADVMTPELRKLLIESRMRKREPKYRALFTSWQLDESACGEVLKIIRERDTQLREVLQKRNRDGAVGAEEFLTNRAVEKQLSETLLTSLLGEKRFRELSLLESQMDSESQAKLQNYLND